ncbi:Imm27 family immunity protein [Pseudovibrio ascidiaceicola]|uniref:Imm27 family immunity protein n=1 Tax=Pseudovibrio ascidiaceicola TaxID=285279 RepID=UPI003D35A955
MKQLASYEEKLIGAWVYESGQVIANATCDRIHFLTNNTLSNVATSNDGWSTLYEDPCDGRLWELTYNDSSSHGAGPPVLKTLTQDEATSQYEWDKAI